MYKQGEPNLWTGRLDSETDPKKFRHFQTVTFEDLSKLEKSSMPSGVGILGYAVDKGVETRGALVQKKDQMRLNKHLQVCRI